MEKRQYKAICLAHPGTMNLWHVRELCKERPGKMLFLLNSPLTVGRSPLGFLPVKGCTEPEKVVLFTDSLPQSVVDNLGSWF